MLEDHDPLLKPPTDPLTRPTTDPLATAATIATYERMVTARDEEIARLQAEVAHLTEQLQSKELDLKQARIMIAYLSERVADLIPRRARPPQERATDPLPAPAPSESTAPPPAKPEPADTTARLAKPATAPWRLLGS